MLFQKFPGPTLRPRAIYPKTPQSSQSKTFARSKILNLYYAEMLRILTNFRKVEQMNHKLWASKCHHVIQTEQLCH